MHEQPCPRDYSIALCILNVNRFYEKYISFRPCTIHAKIAFSAAKERHTSVPGRTSPSAV